ncbi:MAG: hypothetical protein L0Z53_10855 [Acidobacteriales bacterium]|nr:hypothetical protein [Terriglobales bacterium]
MTTSKVLTAVCALALAGCVSVPDIAPDAIGAYAVHVSTPFRGAGPQPVGDNGHSRETNYEALEGALIWHRDGWRAETSLSLVLHSRGLAAHDELLFTVRIGKEFGL